MGKERIKSLALVCLVIVNFVLGAKILSDKKLWPYGYNFFLSPGNLGFFGSSVSGADIREAKTMLTMPHEIVVNTGDQTSRVVVKSNDEFFSEICTSASELIKEAMKAGEKEIAFSDKEEWVSELGARSVCLNYYAPVNMDVFAELCGVDCEALKSVVPSTERIIISADKFVYFENFETGDFYKVEVGKKNNIASVIASVRSSASDNGGIINYSVDLKFDEPFGNQKVLLASAVPVYSSSVSFPVLMSQNPLSDEKGIPKKEVTDKILSLFKINTNTMRRYTEVDGTVVFVENNGILKINPDGMIYYHSTGSEGFVIMSGEDNFEMMGAVTAFANEVNKACGIENGLFTPQTIEANTGKLMLDYAAMGVPVKSEYKKMENAVEVEFKNGGIVSYRHFLRNYEPMPDRCQMPRYIEALDGAIEQYSEDMNGIEIRKIYTAYVDDGSVGEKKADWKVEVKSVEIG